MICLFACYVVLESASFSAVGGLAGNLQKLFRHPYGEGLLDISEVKMPEDVGKWLSSAVTTAFATEEPYIRRMLRNNYVCGIRSNVVHSVFESTKGSVFEDVIFEKTTPFHQF